MIDIPKMRTRDADLGYIRMYIKEIHKFLENGGRLTEADSLLVKEAYEKIQDVYCHILD